MRRITVSARLLAGLVLLIGLLTTLTPAAGAQDSGASVEIHKRICPPGFTGNAFKECHDDPQAGITFSLGGLTATTGASGNARFVGLAEGTYTITEDTLPGHDVKTVVFCARSDALGVPLDFTYVGAGIRIFVPANTAIICDWYNIPIPLAGGASVEIHKRLCPAGFTGTDLFGVCHPNPQPGITFVLDGLSATTDAAGNTRFFNLREGTYTITENPDHARFVVFCARSDALGVPLDFTYVTSGIRIFVPADTAIICDWYDIPAAPAPAPAPVPTPTPTPPLARLPSTGAGEVAEGSGADGPSSYLYLAALALAGGAAVSLRRRPAR